jgi:hypothetical protein
MRVSFLAAALLAGTALTSAAQAKSRCPLPTDHDNGLYVVAYSMTCRQTIVGTVDQPTTITFPVHEQVLRVNQTGAPGNTGAWEGGKLPAACAKATSSPPAGCILGNNLTLWPTKAGTSLMTVITVTAGGQQKPYAFLMKAEPPPKDGAAPTTMQGFIFKGGAPTTLVLAQDARPRWRQPRTRKIKDDPPSENPFAGFAAQGCHYTLKGNPHSPIAPLCPIDNGRWVAMRYPGLAHKPAFWVLESPGNCGADDGKNEMLARQHVSGDYLVIEQTFSRGCLRLGANVLEVINNGYNPAGNPTGTGTTDPAYRRDLLQANYP